MKWEAVRMTELSETAETLVLTPGEITSLFEGGKPGETLMKVVALIASRFNADVCSAYLLEPDRSNLVLAPPWACTPAASARCAWLSARDLPAWSPNR